MIGTLIATVVMCAYLGWYIRSYGVPGSISQTVFMLPHECIFTAIMFAVGFLTIIPMIDQCSENTKCLAFLTIAGMLFVGAAPLGKNCDERVHLGGALFFGICSQIMLALNKPVLLFVWLPMAVLLIAVKGKNYKFWIELACIFDLLIYCIW